MIAAKRAAVAGVTLSGVALFCAVFVWGPDRQPARPPQTLAEIEASVQAVRIPEANGERPVAKITMTRQELIDASHAFYIAAERYGKIEQADHDRRCLQAAMIAEKARHAHKMAAAMSWTLVRDNDCANARADTD